MDNTTDTTTHETKTTNTNTLKGITGLTVASLLIGAVGVGLGIYGVTQSNRALSILDESGFSDQEESVDPGTLYGKPTTVDSIDSVVVAYNKGQDYVEFYNDGKVQYYNIVEDSDEEYEKNINSDTDTLMNYVFKNVLDHTGEEEVSDTFDWAIEIESENGTTSASGQGEIPAWFNDLLHQLNTETYGHK